MRYIYHLVLNRFFTDLSATSKNQAVKLIVVVSGFAWLNAFLHRKRNLSIVVSGSTACASCVRPSIGINCSLWDMSKCNKNNDHPPTS